MEPSYTPHAELGGRGDWGVRDTGGMASSVLKALTGYQGAHSLKHLCGGNAITVYVTDVIKKQFYVSE